MAGKTKTGKLSPTQLDLLRLIPAPDSGARALIVWHDAPARYKVSTTLSILVDGGYVAGVQVEAKDLPADFPEAGPAYGYYLTPKGVEVVEANRPPAKPEPLTSAEADLLRKLTPVGVEPATYFWQWGGHWYLTRENPPGSFPANRTRTLDDPAPAQALVAGGYVSAEPGTEDLPERWYLAAKGAILVEAERRAREKPRRERAKAVALALLEANQLDGRADFVGVYPTEAPGAYDVDFDDTQTGARFVVTVYLDDGERAELQRQ